MPWSKDVRACKTLWTTLVALDQMSEQELFGTAGQKLMKDLTYFASIAGGGTLETRTKGLAFDLDQVFKSLRGAKFESGVTRVAAIDAMYGVLIEPEQTVEQLAEVVDAQYEFVGEG